MVYLVYLKNGLKYNITTFLYLFKKLLCVELVRFIFGKRFFIENRAKLDPNKDEQNQIITSNQKSLCSIYLNKIQH